MFKRPTRAELEDRLYVLKRMRNQMKSDMNRVSFRHVPLSKEGLPHERCKIQQREKGIEGLSIGTGFMFSTGVIM